MEFLKALFEAVESGALTYEQFSQAVADKGIKLADLSKGNYVSKAKYDDEIQRRDTTISDLNGQIATRDTDLANLRSELDNAETDNRTKVATLTNQLEDLQNTYSTAQTEYENKLAAQNYEFAVKEFANSKKFSSQAAKRDFVSSMIAKNLQMEGDKILGADDFVAVYSEANGDAFAVEAPDPKPTITKPTNPTPSQETNPFSFSFQHLHSTNN